MVVVGGANVDIKGRAQAEWVPNTSNPGVVWRADGGVGRNIAENLAVLGCPVRLVAPVGEDTSGEAMVAHLRSVGVQVDHVFAVAGARTGTYVALLDPAGEMAWAVADMAIMDAVEPDHLTMHRLAFQDAAVICLDANLPEPALTTALRLAADEAPDAVLIGEPVSAPKSLRFLPHLHRLHVVTPSRDELAAMSGLPTTTLPEVERAAEALRARGVETVLVTLGGAGVYVDCPAWRGVRPAHSVPVVDVTGAGDAFAAGVAYGCFAGMSWVETVDFAQGLAAHIVSSEHSVLRAPPPLAL